MKYVARRDGDGPFSEPVLRVYFSAAGDGFTWPYKSIEAKAFIQWLDEQARDMRVEYLVGLEKAKRENLTIGDDGELVELKDE